MNAALGAWSNFFVITGSSAGALTGLTFVVITLVAGDRNRPAASEVGVGTFTSPTVVHFSVALFVSVVLTAPWHVTWQPSTVVALGALYGLIYEARVTSRILDLTRHGKAYRPQLDDWMRYVVSPLAAYAVLFGGAVALVPATVTAMFVIAAGTLGLIFVGIHNAWDVVTYLAISEPRT